MALFKILRNSICMFLIFAKYCLLLCGQHLANYCRNEQLLFTIKRCGHIQWNKNKKQKYIGRLCIDLAKTEHESARSNNVVLNDPMHSVTLGYNTGNACMTRIVRCSCSCSCSKSNNRLCCLFRCV